MANKDDNLIKWLNGELTDDEFARTVGKSDLQKYKQITGEIDQWEPTNNDSFRVKLEDILKEPKTITRQLNWWKPISIAASIALILTISVWLLFFSNVSTYYAQAGQTKEIVLPDGLSIVTLASSSSITVDKRKWKKGRRPVKLSGKALFSVEPGDPFTVSTEVGEVAVLGTTFSVDVFDESMAVACYEGKVQAKTKIGAVTIPGGESYLFHQNKWEEMIPIASSGPAWLQGELAYTNAPLVQVIKALEKTFEITIDTGKIQVNRRFTGTIPKNNLDTALKLVFTPLSIAYKVENNKVYLSNN
jgi:ferric-dicitrate binding protein FerR (iron transport regulator)